MLLQNAALALKLTLMTNKPQKPLLFPKITWHNIWNKGYIGPIVMLTVEKLR